MKKNQIMSLMMALTMAGTIAFTSIGVNAAGLTQAESPEQVTYGTVSEEDIAILKSLFDAEYYLEQNRDLISTIGTDFDKLFEHFCKCGVFEGRSCNPNFDPSAYASAYSDLKDVFGTDILQYYKHYATVGQTENRTITTMEAAAKAGITVHPLNNEKVSITPEIYRIATSIGAKDISSVTSIAASINRAHAENAAVVIAPKSAEAMLKAEGLEKVGEISLGDNMNISMQLYIVKGKTGYAAYDAGTRAYTMNGENVRNAVALTVDSVPVYMTADYVAYTDEDLNPYVGFTEIGRLNALRPIVGEVDATLQVCPVKYFAPEYSEAGDPHYKTVSESGPWPTGILTYGQGVQNVVSKNLESSNLFSGDYELDGYYTDDQGNWHEFASAEEKYEYCAATTTTTHTENGTVTRLNSEETKPRLSADAKGDANTEYRVGLDISETEDGKVQITLGISNANDNYGYVNTFEIRQDRLDSVNASLEHCYVNNSGADTVTTNISEAGSSSTTEGQE